MLLLVSFDGCSQIKHRLPVVCGHGVALVLGAALKRLAEVFQRLQPRPTIRTSSDAGCLLRDRLEQRLGILDHPYRSGDRLLKLGSDVGPALNAGGCLTVNQFAALVLQEADVGCEPAIV